KLEIIHSRKWNNPVGALIKALKDNWQRGETDSQVEDEENIKWNHHGSLHSELLTIASDLKKNMDEVEEMVKADKILIYLDGIDIKPSEALDNSRVPQRIRKILREIFDKGR
ncbi:unnamed protein product, partial [marine sediment metagenome]